MSEVVYFDSTGRYDYAEGSNLGPEPREGGAWREGIAPGQVNCVRVDHGIQWAVDLAGKVTTDHGECQACWVEKNDPKNYVCPLHGVQLRDLATDNCVACSDPEQLARRKAYEQKLALVDAPITLEPDPRWWLHGPDARRVSALISARWKFLTQGNPR